MAFLSRHLPSMHASRVWSLAPREKKKKRRKFKQAISLDSDSQSILYFLDTQCYMVTHVHYQLFGELQTPKILRSLSGFAYYNEKLHLHHSFRNNVLQAYMPAVHADLVRTVPADGTFNIWLSCVYTEGYRTTSSSMVLNPNSQSKFSHGIL
jgi:hypothetical protein